MGSRVAALSLATCFVAVAQEVPRVVTLQPANSAEVDAATTTRLVVTFDRAMSEAGFSLCGGGPQFPKLKERPRWQDPRTLVAEVELVPDHEYRLSINCPAGQNTRSKEGVPVAPVAWSFTTLPTQLRPAAEQRQRNEQAFDALMRALATSYSYRDRLVKDWAQLERDGRAAVIAAKTDRGFAAAAAAMLQPTGDLHLYLRYGEQTFGTGSRSVDPLFRRPLVEKLVPLRQVAPQVLAGRTEDGIGYLLIAAWSRDVDPEVVGGAIVELADTRALVVDVRPNSGGDERLAQQVAAWFVTGSKVYAKHRVRAPGTSGFGPIGERSLTGHGGSRHYDRPIAVLTSRCVMSSNESFVLMCRQAKDCVVVGQPTYGSSGNPKPCELGNGVTAFIPSWQDLRPDGTPFEGEGLAPDVLVPCTAQDLESHDPILAKALELLRAKAAPK